MIRYVFRDEFVALKGAKDADPQIIGEALEAISAAHGGLLTPEAVVANARAENSPLHRHFEWRDDVAASLYRLDQAREVIRVVRVDEGDEQPRAFLSISDKGGTAYRSLSAVRGNSQLQLIVLRQAERDLEAWERRYQDLKDICEAVSVARAKVAARRKEAEAAHA